MKYALYLCLLLMLACASHQVQDPYSPTPTRYPAINKMYQRDSLYLGYALNQFGRLGIVGYGIDFTRIDIDTMIYSPDSLNLFALVIVTYVDREKKDTPTVYDGLTALGHRETTSEPYSIYPYQGFEIYVGYRNYNMVRDRLRSAYFKYWNRFYFNYWNHELRTFSEYRGYNANDPKFWDSCALWKKGISIPGHYQFELVGNGDPEMIGVIRNVPAVKYPDSLLKMFQKQ